MPTKTRWIGRPIKRKEDPRLIQGISHYVDDLRVPGMLHAAFVRSVYAHARLRRVDVTQAARADGVVAVLTGADIAGELGTIPVAGRIPGMKIPEKRALAIEKVTHVGEAIAVIVAADRYKARDAVDLVEVDYDPLEAVTDPEKALRKGSPVIHERWKDNVAFTWALEGGDITKAFKNADRVVKQRLVNQRLIPMAMEPRGVLASYAAGEDCLTISSSTQIPHLLRTQIAVMVRVPENTVRVVTPEVGGAFGSKLNVYGEEAVVAYLAKKLGQPVKWVETRRENFLATIHGRDQIDDVEMAVKQDGTILGLKVRIIADIGAYYQLLTPIIPTLTGLMIPGCYKIPAVKVDLTGVFTNKMATDAYRGAGRPEATYLVERMMDVAAQELKMDPAEVRRKNFPKPKEFPFTTATGLTYDSADYPKCLDLALETAGYAKLRREQAALRKQGRYVGIGLSTYVEVCAMGPSSAMPAGGWESGTVRIEPTGKVTVLTGASPHGQGQETSFSQIVAEELGLNMEDVVVIHGDTAAVPYGIGTFGSRATAVGGTAIYNALQKVKEKLRKIAGHVLQADPEKILFADGRLFVKGHATKSRKFAEIVAEAYVARNLPAGLEPGLEATNFFEPSNFTFPFGAHVAVVEVDGETGDIRFLRYLAVDDCGTVVNPLLVDGQIHGGIVQGLGQAVMEEAVFDENGQLITGELTDYAIPRAWDVPWMETKRMVTRSPVNPLGIKGVGEAGTIGATPAIVNAVVDALAPLGVRHIDMPLKRERLWQILRRGRST